jgi:zinc D-Ala-D-Ala dipeptidase
MYMSLPEKFVYLDGRSSGIIIDSRYFGNYNFTGRVVDGYKSNVAILTCIAAKRLYQVQKYVTSQGFSLVVYDAYRPVRACKDFVNWGSDLNDQAMKEIFYPHIEKADAFQQGGYIMEKSSHSRGGTVDLSIIENSKKLITPSVRQKILPNNKVIPFYDDNTVDMGTSFDFLGEESHTKYQNLDEQDKEMRKFLCEAMDRCGFGNFAEGWGDNPKEWWHFTLYDEPFPKQYFDFPVGL